MVYKVVVWYGEKRMIKHFSKASIPPNSRYSIHPFFQIILVENSLFGKEVNEFCPLSRTDDLYLLFCINPTSMDVALRPAGGFVALHC